MRKINKITNIVLIFMLIGMVFRPGLLYSEEAYLRVPLSFGIEKKGVSLNKQVFAFGLEEEDVIKLGEPQEILSGYIKKSVDFRDKLLGSADFLRLLRELFRIDKDDYKISELGVVLEELALNAVSLNAGKKRVYFKVEFFSSQKKQFEIKRVMRFTFDQPSSRAIDRERLAINGKGFNRDGRWEYLLNFNKRKIDRAYVKDGGIGLYNVGNFMQNRHILLIYRINLSSPFDIKTEFYIDTFFPAPIRIIYKRQNASAI